MATLSEALALAAGHHQAGDLAAAEHVYRQILAAEPHCADAWHLWGVLHFQRGEGHIAVEHIGKAIGIDANVATYHGHLGNVLHSQGRLEEAALSLRRARVRPPRRRRAQQSGHRLAGTRRNVVRPSIVIDARSTSIRRAPRAHYNLGLALEQDRQWEPAAASYRQALARDQNFAQAHNNLGNVLAEQGQLPAALDSYRRAISLHPGYVEAHLNLGRALKNQGQHDDAIAHYRRALELNPKFAEAYNNLGRIYQEQAHAGNALDHYRQALVLKPDFAEAHNNLGNLLEEQGQRDDAIRCYRLRHRAEARLRRRSQQFGQHPGSTGKS